MGIVSSAVGKFRTTLLIMLFCIIAGVLGRTSMPIASNPNVTFPWVNISVFSGRCLTRGYGETLLQSP